VCMCVSSSILKKDVDEHGCMDEGRRKERMVCDVIHFERKKYERRGEILFRSDIYYDSFLYII